MAQGPGNTIYPEPLSEKGSGDEIETQRKVPEVLPQQLPSADLTPPQKGHADNFTANNGEHAPPSKEQTTSNKNPSTEQNQTVGAINIVPSTAPPSKALSNPPDGGSYETEPQEQSKVPEAVSEEQNLFSTHIPSEQGGKNVLVSVKDHKKSVKKLESENKTLKTMGELEAKHKNELTKEYNELHDKHSMAEQSNCSKCDEIKLLREQSVETQDQLKEAREGKRKHERRASILEDELRKVKEENEDLKEKNQELCETVDRLSTQLREETSRREQLEREMLSRT